MIVLYNTVTKLPIRPIPKHSLKQGRSVNPEAQGSDNNYDVVSAGNGQHIYIPANRI